MTRRSVLRSSLVLAAAGIRAAVFCLGFCLGYGNTGADRYGA